MPYLSSMHLMESFIEEWGIRYMNEEVNLKWHLEALKKALAMLSSPAEKQVAMMEAHDIPLSMSADFDCHYLHIRQEFMASGLLNSEQFEALDKVDAYFKHTADSLKEDEFDAIREGGATTCFNIFHFLRNMAFIELFALFRVEI